MSLVVFLFLVLISIYILLLLQKNVNGDCLMYGHCNKTKNLLGDTYQNCYTPNFKPKSINDATLLDDLKELCPDLFPDGVKGILLK